MSLQLTKSNLTPQIIQSSPAFREFETEIEKLFPQFSLEGKNVGFSLPSSLGEEDLDFFLKIYPLLTSDRGVKRFFASAEIASCLENEDYLRLWFTILLSFSGGTLPDLTSEVYRKHISSQELMAKIYSFTPLDQVDSIPYFIQIRGGGGAEGSFGHQWLAHYLGFNYFYYDEEKGRMETRSLEYLIQNSKVKQQELPDFVTNHSDFQQAYRKVRAKTMKAQVKPRSLLESFRPAASLVEHFISFQNYKGLTEVKGLIHNEISETDLETTSGNSWWIDCEAQIRGLNETFNFKRKGDSSWVHHSTDKEKGVIRFTETKGNLYLTDFIFEYDHTVSESEEFYGHIECIRDGLYEVRILEFPHSGTESISGTKPLDLEKINRLKNLEQIDFLPLLCSFDTRTSLRDHLVSKKKFNIFSGYQLNKQNRRWSPCPEFLFRESGPTIILVRSIVGQLILEWSKEEKELKFQGFYNDGANYYSECTGELIESFPDKCYNHVVETSLYSGLSFIFYTKRVQTVIREGKLRKKVYFLKGKEDIEINYENGSYVESDGKNFKELNFGDDNYLYYLSWYPNGNPQSEKVTYLQAYPNFSLEMEWFPSGQLSRIISHENNKLLYEEVYDEEGKILDLKDPYPLFQAKDSEEWVFRSPFVPFREALVNTQYQVLLPSQVNQNPYHFLS